MILKIEATNFRSFDRLSYSVDSTGLVAVEGHWNQDTLRSNGCGKSSFVTEVLTWAIFGETTEGQTAADKVRDVVKTGAKSCEVTVTLPFVKWTRSQRIGNKANKLAIEGSDYHRLADAEDHLFKFFPPKKVFSSTLVLGQGIGNRLSGWKPAERSKTLSDLFGLSIFAQARVEVRKVILAWEKARVAANAKLNTIQQQKQQVAAQRGERLTDAAVAKIQEAVKQHETNRATYATHLTAAEEILANARHTLTTITTEISGLQRRFAPLSQTIAGIDQLEVCDRCQRKMTKASKEALTKNMRDELAQIEKELGDRQHLTAPADMAVQVAAAEKERIFNLVQQLDNNISALQRELAVHNSQAQTLMMFDDQEKAANDELLTADHEISYYNYLDEAFGPTGIPLRKMESAITILNTALARICAEVWDSEIFVQLTTEKTLKGGGKKNEIDIIVEGANGPTYASCSPGERRRMDLTLQLALREVLLSSWKTKLPLLVCDDVVDVLDARAKVQLFDNYLVPLSDNSVVFVISPEASLPRAVPRVYIHRSVAGSQVALNEATNILTVEGLAGG